jgi:hypothetical protein
VSKLKKYILLGILGIAIISLAASSYSLTGLFSKAFDKTLYPGEVYEKNITVRNSYNLTVRFQKENVTSSYLTFDSNDTVVVLKDVNGNEVARSTGLVNGKTYFFVSNSVLNSIKSISALNLGEYLDVVNQPFNISFSSTTAYITVRVRYKPSAIAGYVVDELTGQTVERVEVLAFANSADPNTEEPITQNATDSSGRYLLKFQLTDSKSLDIYVKDFDVV